MIVVTQNIPNYLTFLRILIIPIIISTFYFPESKLAHQIGAGLFVVASITDFLDGYIARKYNQETHFGKMLDPIADKILVGTVLIMLVKTNKASAILSILILSREFFVAGLREFLAQIKVSLPVSRLAKTKTFLQMFALTMLILGSTGSGISWLNSFANFTLWTAVILTLFTGYSYFKESLKYIYP